MVKENYSVKARNSRSFVKALCLLSALALPLKALALGDALPNEAQRQAVSVASPVKTYKLVGAVSEAKTGLPVMQATIIIKGTTKGTTTDLDGKFEINVKRGDVLVFTYLGFKTKEVKITNQKVLDVKLKEDSKALEEVVVTAFGTGQKKETVSGSIQTVRPSDLKMPTANLSNAFAGRLSGVIAVQSSGEPGSDGSDFFIRGISTMSDVNKPLIILDGVEISRSDLNSLDPEVIDSFSVLKDATASAMYGTRGANGVMIIKTKSGSDLDHPIIGFRVETYLKTPVGTPKFANAQQYMKMYNEAVLNEAGGNARPYSFDKIRGTAAGKDPILYPNVNWYEELFNKYTINERANFNVRGGTSKITYFMNLNAVHETGMLKGRSKEFHSFNNTIDYMKYAFQNNVDFNISPTTKLALHLNVQLNNFRGPMVNKDSKGITDVFNSVMKVNPVDFPIQYPKGLDAWIHWGGMEKIGAATVGNPLAIATAGSKESFDATAIINIDFDQKLDFITKGLDLKALFSFKNWSKTDKLYTQGYNQYRLDSYTTDANGKYVIRDTPVDGVPQKHNLAFNSKNHGDNRFYFQTFLSYNRAFGDHNVSSMILYNQDEYNLLVLGNDGLSALPQRKLGFAGRLSYDYANRYMLELNAGYNGSESFAKGHRFGFFPSVSLAWNISQEKFWKPIKKYVNSFKIRSSYGLVGNDRIGSNTRFIYMPIVDMRSSKGYTTGFGNSKRNNLKGPKFSRLKNDDITWEVGRKLNLGVDLKFFGCVNVVADFFQEIRSNIFQEKKSIPNFLGSGTTKVYGNLAKVKNWGFDIAADYAQQFGKDWTVQFKGTFTFARNRVIEYDQAANIPPHQNILGKSLRLNKGYIEEGLFIDEGDIRNYPKSGLANIKVAAGDFKYRNMPDVDGKLDDKISASDEVLLTGDIYNSRGEYITTAYPTMPEIVYGFGPTIQWRNLDFGCFFQGAANVSLMMSGFHPFGTGTHKNALSWIADDYWSRDNQRPDALYPRLTLTNNDHNSKASTHWMRNGAFLKMKSAEIGYRYKGARIYFSATNLFTISGFKLWDPEMGGGAGMKYPLQRTFNLGLQVTFK